ncbi:MAG: alpha/beta fold hydrolase [Puniceicoccales bacterium]|jgi:haloalkane dehalogenase|nr:alpha/beta fold hydrolase [Puniceicoccales bacterium]
MTELPAHLTTCYPFAPRWLELPAGRMHYVDTGGDGETLLLLHGNPTWSFLWRDLARLLSIQGFRCVMPDYLGMGLSEKPGVFFRLADRIREVEALVSHLRLTRFHLGVHDWGGAIGMGVAGRMPERIGKIIVTNSAAFHSERIPRSIAICRHPLAGRILVQGLNLFAWPATYMAARRRLSRTVRSGFLAPYDTYESRAALAHFVQDIPLEPADPSYATLSEVEAGLEKLRDKPMLLVWGGRDFCFDDSFLAGWRNRFPAATVRYYCRAGHYVLEDAGEEAVPEIRDFLTRKL